MSNVLLYLTLGLFLSIIDTVIGTLLGFYFFKKIMTWGLQEGYRKSQGLPPTAPELTPIMAEKLFEEHDKSPNLPFPGQLRYVPGENPDDET